LALEGSTHTLHADKRLHNRDARIAAAEGKHRTRDAATRARLHAQDTLAEACVAAARNGAASKSCEARGSSGAPLCEEAHTQGVSPNKSLQRDDELSSGLVTLHSRMPTPCSL